MVSLGVLSHVCEDSFQDAHQEHAHTPDAMHAHMSDRQPLPPGDLKRLLSQKPKPKGYASDNNDQPPEINVNGVTCRQVDMHRVHYYHSHRMELKGSNKGALVDRGANGGTCGDDVRVIEKSHGIVDVRGIDNHEMPNTPIVTAGGVVHAQSGEVIAIMHQHAHRNGAT